MNELSEFFNSVAKEKKRVEEEKIRFTPRVNINLSTDLSSSFGTVSEAKREHVVIPKKPPSKVIRMTIDVLAHRLNLLDSSEPLENKTFQQIADYHGMTKQRVEQIEQQVKKYLLIKELERTDDQ